MPVRKVKGGYKFGKSGKLWKDRPESKSHDTVASKKPLGVSGKPILKIVMVE